MTCAASATCHLMVAHLAPLGLVMTRLLYGARCAAAQPTQTLLTMPCSDARTHKRIRFRLLCADAGVFFCCRTVLSLLPPNVYQHVAAQQEHVPHLSPQVGIRQRPQASTGNARGGSPDRNARGGSPERDMIITANPWQLGVVCAARRSVSVFLSYICSDYVGIVCAMYAYPDRGQICSPPRQLSSRGPLGVQVGYK